MTIHIVAMDLGNRGVLSQDEAYTLRSPAEYVAAELACEMFPRNRLLTGSCGVSAWDGSISVLQGVGVFPNMSMH